MMSTILETIVPEVSPSTLLSIRARAKCPKCGSMQQWYCYFCHLLTNAPSFSPARPPIPVSFLCYRGEKNSKSSVHGVVTSSENVTVRYFSGEAEEDLRDTLEDGSVLLMTGRGAKKVSEVQWSAIRRIYILDCTWNQVNKCLRQLGLYSPSSNITTASDAQKCTPSVQLVELEPYTTIFWRQHKQKNSGCLSSAEALYYLLSELNQQGLVTRNLDNILTFFLAQAVLIYKRSPWVNKQVDAHYKEIGELFKRRWGIDVSVAPQSSVQSGSVGCCPRCGSSAEGIIFKGSKGCVVCLREELKRALTKTLARCPVFFPGGRFLVLSFSNLCFTAFRNYMRDYLGSSVSALDDVMLPYSLRQHNDEGAGYFSILHSALHHAQAENIPLVFDIRDSNSVASTIMHSAVLGDLSPGIASAEEFLEFPNLQVDPTIAYKRYLSDATQLYKPKRQLGHVSLFRPFLSIPEHVLKCYADPPITNTNSSQMLSLVPLSEEKQYLMPLLRELVPSPEAVCGLSKKLEWRAQSGEVPCPLCGAALDDSKCICSQL
ncbi:ATP-dependent permease [Giardia duodenalis]|uniref:tRNA-uridine aminocarboxypropyltransferase 1 n=1 Tax=Giardia intestinalis TaxID=5741 RepID=V6T9U2_GIAIN|nr:ATP-dependent permease [Giardia intestinalis]